MSGKRTCHIALAVFCSLAYSVRAQTIADRFCPSPNGPVRAIVQQSDGRLVIGGEFTKINGTDKTRIGRIHIDGSLDTTFSALAEADLAVTCLARQSDDKIIVGGAFVNMNGQGRKHLARLEADGNLDSSFNPGVDNIGLVGPYGVYMLAVQSDGKILVGGDFTTLAGQTRNRIGRLNIDGTLDTSFNAEADSVVFHIAVQPDGKIIIAGFFTSVNGQPRNGIARLNTDGTLDDSFNPNAEGGDVYAAQVQPDGKIIAAGAFATIAGTARRGIARLNADGTIDPSFDPGSGSDNDVYRLLLQPNGKIVLGGIFTHFNGAVHNCSVRLNTDGSVDSTFDDGNGFNSQVWCLYQQADGKIVAGGVFTLFYDAAISRPYLLRLYESEGKLDANLFFDTPLNGSVYATALQRNENILIGGDFTTANGEAHQHIARVGAHGYVDASFNASAVGGGVWTIVVQPDDRIIIGGYFTTVNGAAHAYLARLLSDGTTDGSFTSGIIADGGVRGMALQPDGKIVIGGAFTSIDGVTYNGLARLNINGTVDASFNPGIGVAGVDYVNTVALQPDGKILVGGTFTSLGGQAINRIGRLNSDGSVDTAFNPNANSEVRCITVQPDGKILVGGLFTSMGGTAINRIARLVADGSVDSSFNLPNGAGGSVRSIGIQCNGKIIVGGAFASIGGDATRKYITCLNSDGSLDTSFAFAEYPNDAVNAVTIQNDGKIVCGGLFANWNDALHDYVARIATTNAAGRALSASAMGDSITWLISGSAPDPDRTIFEYSFDGVTWPAAADGTRISGGWQITGLDLPPNTNFYIRATGVFYGSHYGAGGSLFDSTLFVHLATPRPVITNVSGVTTGNYGAVNYTLSGTNNINVTGTMRWVNDLGGSASFAAASPWSATVTGLSVGANTITIYASNTVGDVGNSSITIVQRRNDRFAGDFDGDRLADPAYYNSTNWYEWLSSDGYSRSEEDNYAMPGTFPATADFDGDGLADPAVYNNRDGTWHVWLSGSLYWHVGPLAYGIVGAAPIPADFDGDRLADFAVFASGNWYAWLSTANYLGFGPFNFGSADSIPTAGDFDGDRKSDPATYWNGYWFAWLSSIDYIAIAATVTDDPNAYPITADFDGDGLCDLAVVNGSTWYARLSTAGYQQFGPFTFDASGWRFLAADIP